MSAGVRRRLSFDSSPGGPAVSGLFHRPNDAWALYVLAHGAGAGMEHPFMQDVAERLFAAGVATFRYQFPYMEARGARRARPDAPEVAQATVRSAVAKAAELAPDLPLLAGGKSFGGRMTSSAAASEALAGVRGIAFLGFPLHPSGRRDDRRARHLDDVDVPMLFVQGTRDSLADIELVRGLVRRLGERATLHVVDGGDHSFKVLKRVGPGRSGHSQADVMDDVQNAVTAWVRAAIRGARA